MSKIASLLATIVFCIGFGDLVVRGMDTIFSISATTLPLGLDAIGIGSGATYFLRAK